LFHAVEEDALALLRAIKEYHERENPQAPLSDGRRLAPALVAEGVGVDPETLRYAQPFVWWSESFRLSSPGGASSDLPPSTCSSKRGSHRSNTPSKM